ncbi:hypothetical protein DENSPDRAFT_835437 [Dentipellis sp. KUC8613]|nr:hypothetical protein DENSPDRAFT_835437 [Dentipellis sp. KUC8613]
MDTAAFAHSAFGRLPYFNPIMMINRSGLCATTKLIQCRHFGTYQCEVSGKFAGSPEQASDLSEEDFYARKNVIDQVQKWVEDNEKTEHLIHQNEWVPILYNFEVVRSSAKRQRDWGHVVFTDLTTTRLLLVMCFGASTCMCGNPYHDDYGVLTKYQADRLMSLLTYVYHKDNKPLWVRATYTTMTSKKLRPEFLNTHEPINDTKKPPIFHVTAEDFVPSLLSGELEQIDNLLVQSKKSLPPAELRNKVLGSKETRPTPQAWSAGMEKNPRQCAFCEKVGAQTMPTCSGCKLVRYCDRQCQIAAWPSHKPVCKKAKASGAK